MTQTIDINEEIQKVLTQKINSVTNNIDIDVIILERIDDYIFKRAGIQQACAQQISTLVEEIDIEERIDDYIKQNASVQQLLAEKINSIVNSVDIGSIILERIDDYINERASSGKLSRGMISHQQVDWTNYSMPASHVGSGVIKNFASEGIEDRSTEINLTVLDGQVIIENETITNHLTVVDSATINNLSVGNLVINDNIVINDTSFAEQIKGLIDDRIIQKNNESAWDTYGKSLKSNNTILIDNTRLGNTVVESNLRKLGRLTSLAVTGTTELAESVFIENGKLGINTDEPSGALTVWDEESEVSVKKYKNRTMYIGSTRDSELVLGVGGDAVLSINKDGIETNSVKVGNITIATGNKEPNKTGAPGDLVVNDNGASGQPWAWRCTGSNKWLPLT
jgi:uncharacterized protein YeeX (DUF496 family)